MTIIAAALDHTGTIYMGADSVSLQGDSCVRLNDRAKVYHKGEFLIGGSGTLRVNQLMECVFEPPLVNDDPYAYMVQHFAPAWRALVKEQGCELTTQSGSIEADGRYLVALRGCLFELDCGYGVFSPRSGFHAIGCAAQEAMAGMFTARQLGFSAEATVKCGLEAAAEFDASIRPPFTILSLASQSRRSNVERSGGIATHLKYVGAVPDLH